MDEFPITAAIGIVGWLMLIIRDTVKGCAGGQWLSALLSMVILTILNIEIWAIGPSQLQRIYLGSHWPIVAIYSAALLPYAYLLIRFAALSINQDTSRQASPSTEQKGDND